MTKTAMLLTALCVLLASCMHSGADRAAPLMEDSFSQIEDELAAADRLFVRGQKSNEPVVMGLAAEMRALSLGSWQPAGDLPGGVLSPEEMLDMARQAAGTDTLALAYLDRIEARRTRGRVNGPVVRHLQVSRTAPFSEEILFQADLPAIIYTESEPGASYALSILQTDTLGVQCSDPDKIRQICRWQADGARPVSVQIETENPDLLEILFITN
ncbi:MAG: hypothetical protein MRY64_01845 [Hyphomonadaceae bacterium]|nr:hypothetical protein [Hyphomonadaceae bacterium]